MVAPWTIPNSAAIFGLPDNPRMTIKPVIAMEFIANASGKMYRPESIIQSSSQRRLKRFDTPQPQASKGRYPPRAPPPSLIMTIIMLLSMA
jgi:hypothetical protein